MSNWKHLNLSILALLGMSRNYKGRYSVQRKADIANLEIRFERWLDRTMDGGFRRAVHCPEDAILILVTTTLFDNLCSQHLTNSEEDIEIRYTGSPLQQSACHGWCELGRIHIETSHCSG